MKNPTLVKMIAMNGAMKAQMKLDLGFKKQLYKWSEISIIITAEPI